MTVTKSAYARKDFELYQTETWAVKVLASHLKLPTSRIMWEPSAGNHRVSDVFSALGHPVITSDVTFHGRPHHFIADFFTEFEVPVFDDLITNPPYGKQNILAARYARRALSRCDGWVALLLLAKFDFGVTRTDLFQDNPRWHTKLCLLDRIQWFDGPDTGTEDHAWYIWCPNNPAYMQPPGLAYAANEEKRNKLVTE